ncbi:acyltransferase [Sphingomonas bacterium]|uniref:acyltransferase family protein n=1 Tax=Sphingomonas bacterium TaxID=1895847 RepID=UPI0026216B5F|nr:acyltransferase [Sphingomonas bacterium]MDB5677965.1 acyltransferase [Sphingomonas bacterium]
MIHGRHLSDQAAQIDALDGIRGLAVLYVLAAHLSQVRLNLIPGLDLSHMGQAGVYLFFTLSAFLLMMGFLRQGAQSLEWRHLVYYAIRRVLRIAPLYILFLPIAYAEVYRLRQGEMPRIDTGKMLQALTLQRADGVNWSVVVEVKFYVILPLIAACCLLLFGKRTVAAAVMLIALAVGVAIMVPLPARGTAPIIALWPYLPPFLPGCAAAIVFHRAGAHPPEARAARLARGAAVVIGIVALVLAPLIASMLAVSDSPERAVGRWVFSWSVLWAALIVTALLGGKWPRRLFEMSWLRRVGQLSFSSYLVHAYMITAVPLGLAAVGLGYPLLEAWATVAVTFAIAEIMFRSIERPFARSRWAARMLGIGPARNVTG